MPTLKVEANHLDSTVLTMESFELAKLPAEIVGKILSTRDCSALVLKLWKCGDLLLNSKLSSGLTYLYLRQGRVATGFRSFFPRLVCHLHGLRYLRIDCRYSIMVNPTKLTPIISNLPPGLQTLIIRDSFALAATLDLSHVSVDTFQLLKSEDILSAPALNLSRILPQLRTLKLMPSMLADESTFHRLPPQCFALFPPTLTKMRVPIRVTTEQQWNLLKQLPSALCELDLRLDMDELPSLKWPSAELPNVETIRAYMNPDSLLTWLPPTLTKLKGKYAWSLESARAWPSSTRVLHLEALNLDSFTSANTSWHAELPKSLEVLEIVKDAEEVILASDLFCNMPPSLTDAKIEIPIDFSDAPNQMGRLETRNFSKLKMLSMYQGITCAQLCLLPRTLEDLDISLEADPSDPGQAEFFLDISNLPPHLTSFSLYFEGSNKHHLQGRFPSSLTALDISSDELDTTSLPKFPDSITRLTLGLPLAEDADSLQWALPRSLETFFASTWHCDALEAFPKSLTSLRFRALLGCFSSNKFAEGCAFERLPQGLYSFSTKCDHPSGPRDPSLLPAQRMQHLRSLRYFTLYGKGESAWLRYVPPTLMDLTLSLGELNDKDIVFIPPKLKHFDLGDSVSYDNELLCATWPLTAEPMAVRNRAPVQKAFRERLKAALERY